MTHASHAVASGGLQWAFGLGAVLAVAVVALALTMPGRVQGVAGPGPAGSVDVHERAVEQA